jgi:hypothetical protein
VSRYNGSHYSTFPEALAGNCITAGTSGHGCCPECLAPYERVVSSTKLLDCEPAPESLPAAMRNQGLELRTSKQGVGHQRVTVRREHQGWRPTCSCASGEPISCTVLDPFAGSGTTLAVAKQLGRDWIGIDASADCVRMCAERLAVPVQMALPTED